MDKVKPVIDAPATEAPLELSIKDLEVGSGPEVAPGAVVDVHYVGVDFDSGEEQDSIEFLSIIDFIRNQVEKDGVSEKYIRYIESKMSE